VLLRRALELAPEHAEAHHNLGAILAIKGEYAVAVLHFRRALAARPGFAQAQEGLKRAQAALAQ
jgi:Tfp pilus assembly protein PilF